MPQLQPIDDAYIDEVIKSKGPYNQLLNTTQGIRLRELIKRLRDHIKAEGFEYVEPINGILDLP